MTDEQIADLKQFIEKLDFQTVNHNGYTLTLRFGRTEAKNFPPIVLSVNGTYSSFDSYEDAFKWAAFLLLNMPVSEKE